MRTRLLAPVLALLLLASTPARPAPVLARGPSGFLVLSRLPPVLGQAEIRRQLETGLTTTLAFEIRVAGSRTPGAARVDVRYEPWDEVFYLRQIEASGRVVRARATSFAQLAEHWRKLELAVLDLKKLGPRTANAEVRLRVIPFSRAEQLETQRWMSRSLTDREPGSAGALSGALDEPATPIGQVLDLLLATSLERGALVELSWKVALAGRGTP